MEQKKKLLAAEDILTLSDTKYQELDIPEWGGTVRLRSLTGLEAAVFLDASTSDKKTSVARLVALSVVNEEGEPVFTEEHVLQLQRKSLRALLRIQDAALVLNGMTEKQAASAKNV